MITKIAYKKIILGSDKDLEDARHLEIVCKDFLSQEKIKYYEGLVHALWTKN